MILGYLRQSKSLKRKIIWVIVPALMLFGGLVLLQPGAAEAHCDTLDGPVVKAAQQALEAKNVNLILPYVPKAGEDELKKVFEKTLTVRGVSKEARELADYYFFETAVRLHRAGEGAPYTGLKPAGLDHGPALPAAERALETGSVDELKKLMAEAVAEVVEERFEQTVAAREKADDGSVEAARERVEAELRFQVFIHELYSTIKGDGGQHNHGGVGRENSAAAAQHDHTAAAQHDRAVDGHDHKTAE